MQKKQVKSSKEITITLEKDKDKTLEIHEPNGARINCKVEKGSGEVSLYKNGNRLIGLEKTYVLSDAVGLPTTIRLNTSTLSPDGKWELYIVATGPDENTFKVKLLPREE